MNNNDLISACYEAARAYQIVDGDIANANVSTNPSGIFTNGNASFSENASLDSYFELPFTSASESLNPEIAEYEGDDLNEDFADRSSYVFSEDFVYCNILNRQIEKYENSVSHKVFMAILSWSEALLRSFLEKSNWSEA